MESNKILVVEAVADLAKLKALASEQEHIIGYLDTPDSFLNPGGNAGFFYKPCFSVFTCHDYSHVV